MSPNRRSQERRSRWYGEVTRRCLALKSLTSYSPSCWRESLIPPESTVHCLSKCTTVKVHTALDMALQNRSRISHNNVYILPGSDSIKLEFTRALAAIQRANTWLYEDIARRTAAQEIPPTFNDDDGYTADTEAEGTSYRPRRRALIS